MILYPECPEAARDMIRSAANEKKPVIPAGGGSHISRWAAVEQAKASVISCQKLKRVISVEPENLLAIVEAGMTPAEIRAVLEPANLYWPVSGLDRRSLGAIMAEGAISRESMARGPMIDWILGTTFIEPGGRLIRSGGRTLKNVSGYDLTRFQWEAWGTLGRSTAFILQCMPPPECSQILEMNFSDGQSAAMAAENIIKARIFPQSLVLKYQPSCWSLFIWLSGFAEYVEAQALAAAKEAGAEIYRKHDSAINFWNDRTLWSEKNGSSQWLASRQTLLDLAKDLEAMNTSVLITEADIDVGGSQAVLNIQAETPEFLATLAAKGMRPRGPALEGEIYRRLKKGLDPDDLFFPSQFFRFGT